MRAILLAAFLAAVAGSAFAGQPDPCKDRRDPPEPQRERHADGGSDRSPCDNLHGVCKEEK